MKRFWFVSLFLCLCGCVRHTIINDYKLETYNNAEVPSCVNYRYRVALKPHSREIVDECLIPGAFDVENDDCKTLPTRVVNYKHCLKNLPKPVHLVEKTENNMKICYDRNNKIRLPISYCQKDMINYNIVNVNTNVNMKQSTSVNNKLVFE